MSAVMKQEEFKGLVDQPAKDTQTDNDLGRTAGRLLLPAQAMGLRWSIRKLPRQVDNSKVETLACCRASAGVSPPSPS